MSYAPSHPATPVEAPTAPTQADADALTIRRMKGWAAFLLLVLAAVSFTAGVPGLLAAGLWAQLGALNWLLPIMIDGGLIFSAISAMAWRAETARAGLLAWTMVAVLSAVSVAAQVVHVMGAHAGQPTPEALVGAAIASLFPLTVLASTRMFELLRFGRLVDRAAARATRNGGNRAGRRVNTKAIPRTAPQTTRAVAPRTPSRAASHAADPALQGRVAALRTAGHDDPTIAVTLVRDEGASQRAAAAALGRGKTSVARWLEAA